MASQNLILALAITMVALTMQVYAQINTACSPSMLSTFSPCISFITNNGTTPTTDCCNSLRSVMSNGTDCMCLIATGGVPFQIPVNRTLAVSLPQACNMPGVPLQCKAASTPIPAPGPAPSASSPTGSTVPESVSPTLAPEADTPPSATGTAGAPTTNSGSRPVLTPSAAVKSSHGFSSSLLLAVLAAAVLKYY